MINEANEGRRYDYIVVGAGAAGSVLAAELSASGAQVLVIESGGPDDAPTIMGRSALAAFVAEGMAVVTLLGLKNQSALVLQRSAIFSGILIPVGTAITMVDNTKKVFAFEVPTVNMWCAHTLIPINPMQTIAATMTGYPNIAFREKTGITSDATANAGITRT